MGLQITKMLLPSSKYSLKCPNAMNPIGVTVHETGNIATAMAEVSYMIGNNTSTSYHFAVDETRAVQGVPLNRNAFHAGDGRNGRGNARTIGVEHCYNWTGGATTKNNAKYNALYQKALTNGIELIAQLFIDYPAWGVPEHGKNIWRHYDQSGKNCPQRMIEEGYWNTYVARVKARYLELKGGNKPVANKTVAKNPDKEGRSTAFKRGDKVRLSASAKRWLRSSTFDLGSFKSTYEVDWLNVDGTIYISPIGADWGGNVLESDIELARNNDIQKDDIIILRPQATNWFGGTKITDGMKKVQYSVRERKGNTLYIDNGQFRGLIYDWDAIKK